MKLFCYLLLSIYAAAEVLAAPSINVTTTGVGIGTVTPAAPLEVKGLGVATIRINPDQPLGIGSNSDGYEMNMVGGVPDGAGMGAQIRLGGGTRGDADVNVVQFKQNGVERLRIHNGGNVGIGVSTPSAPLHVAASGYFTLMSTGTGLGPSGLIALRNVNTVTGWNLGIEPGAGWATGPAGTFYIDKDGIGPQFAITPAGNVGIGTVMPSHKLAVNGQVKSKGFIQDTSNWSDYVFDPGYRLAPLAEVEAHIKEKKHLPGVPSEAELVKNGLDLGEMSKVQMAQIEQLMLHVIALNKQVQAQAAEIKQLKAAAGR